jgi:hypothetical protein
MADPHPETVVANDMGLVGLRLDGDRESALMRSAWLIGFVRRDRIPFLRWSDVAAEAGQERLDLFFEDEHVGVLGPSEALSDSPLDEVVERCVESADIEECAGLLMETELRPGPLLADFFKRAGSSREGEEGVCKRCHDGFPLVHIGDDAHFGQHVVADLAVHERLRHDADDAAAVFEGCVGDRPHEADRAAAVDDLVPGLGQVRTHVASRANVFWVAARVGAAEDGDTRH